MYKIERCFLVAAALSFVVFVAAFSWLELMPTYPTAEQHVLDAP
jgi:hypothetical protein